MPDNISSSISKIKKSLAGIPDKATIYVGVSGGVDSAVTAVALSRLGYDVVSVYMNCYDDTLECTSVKDASDALSVMAKHDIQFVSWDYREKYQARVLDSFYDSYARGLTPNPDILCNAEIKFGVFMDDVINKKPGAYIATGHYARVVRKDDQIPSLATGVDAKKDQSYFLYKLASNPSRLSRVIFPLGELHKTEVRDLARHWGLSVSDKHDSSGICFVGNVKLRQFMHNRVDNTPGSVINTHGQVIGTHNGLNTLTIGQRHGFSVSDGEPGPYYVVDKLSNEHKLIVGTRSEAMSTTFYLENIGSDASLLTSFQTLYVRVRHLGDLFLCKSFLQTSDGLIKVESSEPIFGVAAGQSAVFYSSEVIVGGGEIVKVDTEYARQLTDL